ncbi:hypothetical protein RHMOL_Rhmol01G0250200 [Rhododendron molle]|uniref:Uncharacterized protein n=1 Tax=Rhododendron molle TaxID=49168 RepID=A0ACC0Q8C0_RHOML|nr:hypothetical protein RHMOL_Rhmol01G0250200 [Rhododendron molle]
MKEQERVEEKEEEKERKEAELDNNAKISSFARKRPSHRSTSTQLSNFSLPHQSPSHGIPIIEPIVENLDSMVDLNQVGDPGNSIEPSNVGTFNTENLDDSPIGVPEILSTESLETPFFQTSSPAVDIPTPQVVVQPSLEESIPLKSNSLEATTHVVQEKTTLAEEGALELQALRTYEEELIKSLADVRQKISKSTSKLATFEQHAIDQC